MTTIHHLINTKTPNYPNQSPLNTQCLRYILRIISALRNAPKELRLKLTGLARCLHQERPKAVTEYVPWHVRKAYPIHHLQATMTRNRETSDEKRATSTTPLYSSREYSTNAENIRQINLFLQNKPNFKKVKLSINAYKTRTYAKIDTW